MGIKDDASELVLCMEDGSIDWCERSLEEVHRLDEDAPPTSNIADSIGHNLSLLERFKQLFKRPNAVANERLIDNNEGDNQSDVEHISVQIRFDTSLPTYTRKNLAKELEEASFEVSPIFEKVTRISKLGGVEEWDLETRKELKGGVTDIFSTKRCSYSYSQISSITEKVHNELMLRSDELLRGTSISLTKRTTLVQSSREDIVVGGNSCAQGFIQEIESRVHDLEYHEGRQEHSHSIYVVNLKDVECRRRLSGRNLDPEKGLTISHDGRHVACLAGDFGSRIVVWNAYASERLLPDYNFLSLTLGHDMSRKEVIRRDILPLIDEFGINFFMFRHTCGMSIFDEAIYHFNNYLMKSLLQHALDKKVKVSLMFSKKSQVCTSKSNYHNVVEAAIVERSPKTLGVILKYLLKRVTHEAEVATILKHSLVDILQVYPALFTRTIRDYTGEQFGRT